MASREMSVEIDLSEEAPRGRRHRRRAALLAELDLAFIVRQVRLPAGVYVVTIRRLTKRECGKET